MSLIMFSKLHSHQNPITLSEPAKHFKTQQGLAYTPSQMNELRNKGIPISNMMVSETLFVDGDLTGSMEYDPVLARGINEIDAWNMECEAKKNLLRGHKQDVESFES
ncbi:hypothetical protein [Microvirus mar53]|uniref:Uncharacterized protein n=1 Tax=Microvirus mar53 TaxID=2851189 RepID=A0A8F5XPK8_9VIRU|nr:hypothetical protein [Microvirus mar53]